jgi:uncharacterized protein YcbK (DUF882 family)
MRILSVKGRSRTHSAVEPAVNWGLIMHPTPYLRRAIAACAAAAILAAGAADSVQPAFAGSPTSAASPKHQVAVHDFGHEHAFLADSIFDKMNPLILAAMPRGKSAIVFRAPSRCVPGSLIRVLKRVSAKYGPITVNSTWRAPGKNRRVGGRGKSMHLSCRAVDFRVHGSSRGLARFLIAQRDVGGFNRYPSGFYHIDNGPRRTW